jgi:hypothetical protein
MQVQSKKSKVCKILRLPIRSILGADNNYSLFLPAQNPKPQHKYFKKYIKLSRAGS